MKKVPELADDLFFPDEAATYLRLPSRRSFNRLARQFGVRGKRVGPGNRNVFSRKQVDYIKRGMFGEVKPLKVK